MAQTREAALAYLAGQLAHMLMEQTGDANIAIITSERINKILAPEFGEDPYPPDAERPQLSDEITSEWTSAPNARELDGFQWATIEPDDGVEAYTNYLWNWYTEHCPADASRVAMTRGDIRHTLRVRLRPEQ